MFVIPFLLLAVQFSGIIAAPLAESRFSRDLHAHGSNFAKGLKGAKGASSTTSAAAAATSSATATPATEEEGNELNINGAFATPVALGGGDVKTDVVFTKGVVGSLEIEFQDDKANTLTVTENKTPGKAPAGFTLLDPLTYRIELKDGADGLTLQKVDYIFDPNSAALKDVDISKAVFGKLCTDTNTFVIDDALGELEFEDDENEITLTVKSMIGEWGVFIPSAAANNGQNNEAEEKKDETEVEGAFDKAIATPGGNSKTDILFPPSAAGLLEIEINSTSTNAVTVKKNDSPVAPPAGFLFVDPSTFQITTEKATNTATDQVKVDYIFTPAVLAAVDPTKAVIGKLDTATQKFVTDLNVLKAAFEFEAG
ncbi:hypothetical protein D9613_001384 [Agrocybe pediades]|uniref:Uncharacterized protein n=1 Tax=Agrocybe pediades TaxID=84607 RepID=A0A8H4VV68_9AGAR|nr:hypothetical protein D9613_001384 [Agrocybe pediades]